MHTFDIYYKPCEDGEMLQKVTAQVKMTQTARTILETDQGAGQEVGLKCRDGVWAQMSGVALPKLVLSPRVILQGKNDINKRHVRMTDGYIND